jgi:hypothetical protein
LSVSFLRFRQHMGRQGVLIWTKANTTRTESAINVLANQILMHCCCSQTSDLLIYWFCPASGDESTLKLSLRLLVDQTELLRFSLRAV